MYSEYTSIITTRNIPTALWAISTRHVQKTPVTVAPAATIYTSKRGGVLGKEGEGGGGRQATPPPPYLKYFMAVVIKMGLPPYSNITLARHRENRTSHHHRNNPTSATMIKIYDKNASEKQKCSWNDILSSWHDTVVATGVAFQDSLYGAVEVEVHEMLLAEVQQRHRNAEEYLVKKKHTNTHAQQRAREHCHQTLRNHAQTHSDL